MTNNSKEQITVKLEQKIHDLGISNNEFAKRFNINAGHLSLILNRKWKEQENLVSDEKWRAIGHIVGYFQEWKTAETPDFIRITSICAHAQSKSVSKAIADAPGYGKSHSLEHYANTHKNVYYLEAAEYFTKKVFLQKLMSKMGIMNMESSISNMVDEIVSYLSTKDRPLIIIDEADKLKDNLINLYNAIYNATEGKVGFVLSGTNNFEFKVAKGMRLNKIGYIELHSRIGGEFKKLFGIRQPVISNNKSVPNNSIAMICEANGVYLPDHVSSVYQNSNGDIRRVKALVQELKLKQGLNNEN